MATVAAIFEKRSGPAVEVGECKPGKFSFAGDSLNLVMVLGEVCSRIVPESRGRLSCLVTDGNHYDAFVSFPTREDEGAFARNCKAIAQSHGLEFWA